MEFQKIITEIVGDMSDREFADSLGAFTEGKLYPARGTVQKWRTGQREPNFETLQVLLAYAKAFNRLSPDTLKKLAEIFYLPILDDSKEYHDKHASQYQEMDSKEQWPHVTRIPIVGKVPAGYPTKAEEYTEGYVSLPKIFLKDSDYFLLRVSGESMKDVDINDGDLVLVRKAETAEDGQAVVARVGGEVTVKRFYKVGDTVTLVPANKDFRPIKATEIEVIGIVERVMKNWEE